MPTDERMTRRIIGCLINPPNARQLHTLPEVKAIVTTVASSLDIPAFMNIDPLKMNYEGDRITFRVIGRNATGTIKYKGIDKHYRFYLDADSLLEN